MSSRVLVVRHDQYHPKEVIDPAVASVFSGDEWQVQSSERVRDVLGVGEELDLAVFFTNGVPKGEEPLSRAEEQGLADLVDEGMGMLRIHAGLVLIAAGWAHEQGAGRLCSLVPGHTPEVVSHPMMLKMMGNAARWCARR